MAGYMTKLQGYVYEGELVNGAANAVQNGILMVQNGDHFELPAADSGSKFICKEATTIYDGVAAYRFIADTLAKRYYFVETSEEDFYANTEYDGRTAEFAVGALLRAHPLLPGEEFVTNMVTGTPTAGTAYGVKADGTIG